MNVGYIRVSSKQQNYDRQFAALSDKVEKIFSEKKTGGTLEGRTELRELIDYVRAGDTVYVSSIDRLGRNLIDILTASNELDNKGVNIVSIKEGIDTSKEIGKMYMVIAGILAEVELSLINERTAEGRAVAKSEGRSGGRPRIKINESQEVLLEKYNKREISSYYCQELLHMSRATFFRRMKEYNDNIYKENMQRILDEKVVDFGEEGSDVPI